MYWHFIMNKLKYFNYLRYKMIWELWLLLVIPAFGKLRYMNSNGSKVRLLYIASYLFSWNTHILLYISEGKLSFCLIFSVINFIFMKSEFLAYNFPFLRRSITLLCITTIVKLSLFHMFEKVFVYFTLKDDFAGRRSLSLSLSPSV